MVENTCVRPAAILLVLCLLPIANAQRPHGGGGGRAKGGMSRPAPSMNRPGAQARPAGHARPATPARPAGGAARPAMQQRPQRPAGSPGMARPNVLPGGMPTGGGNRPAIAHRPRPTPGAGGIARPTPQPGAIGGGAQRPARPMPLPGQIGGGGSRPTFPTTRPGFGGGGVQRPTRPAPLPGDIGGIQRPSPLPGQIGGGQRPTRPAPLPGQIGGGSRPNLPRPLPGDIGGGQRPTRPVPLPGDIGGIQRPTRPVPLPGDRPQRPVPLPGRPGRPDWGGGNWGGGNNGGGWAGGNWGNGNWGNGNWGNGNWGGNWGNNYWSQNNNNWNINNWNVNNNNYYNFNPGWSGSHYGNWHHGCWGGGFWNGFSTGVISSWGTQALYRPGYTYASWSYLPTAWNAPVYTNWGLGSVASSWIYAGYANPYATTQTQVVEVLVPSAAQGSTERVVAYDYAQPIDTAEAPSETSKVELAQQAFETARSQFAAGNYGRALSLADQALADLPNDPALHEFRALALFALERYNEAAAVAYAVLSAGPGWNWTTMAGLYDSVDTYSKQLRALEAYARRVNDAEANFLLGYHYLVQGHTDDAAARFAQAARLRPEDKLSAKFAQALAAKPSVAATPPSPEARGAGVGAAPQKDATQEPPANEPPANPPPAQFAGTWVAKPEEGVTITLAIGPERAFTWTVTQGGRTQSIEGEAGYQDDVLVLGQSQGPPLAGKVRLDPSGNALTFKPVGAPDDVAALEFQRRAG